MCSDDGVLKGEKQMQEIGKTAREAIIDNELDSVVGGEGYTYTPWICPYCGKTVMVKTADDAKKHAYSCPSWPKSE